MKNGLGVIIVLTLIGSFIPHQASAARGGGGRGGGGGGAHFSGGGGAHFNAGGGAHFNAGGGAHFNAGGGAMRQSFGTVPTFSVPHSFPQQNFQVARPNFESRPFVQNRPAFENRPAVENRPDFENRLANENRPNIDFDHGIATHPAFDRGGAIGDFNRGDFNRGDFANREGLGVRPTINHFAHVDVNHNNTFVNRTGAYGNWYHGDWHDHWDHHWDHRPIGWWGPNWWGAGFYPGYAALTRAVGRGVTGTTRTPTTPRSPSRAIVGWNTPQPLGAGVGRSAEPLQTAARPSDSDFQHGSRYVPARRLPVGPNADQSSAKILPSDAVLHEFRALVLFALQQ